MAVSYSRLWKVLIDKKMSRAEMRKKAKLAPNTLTKLIRDEEVSLDVLSRICHLLGTDFGEIVEYIDEETDK